MKSILIIEPIGAMGSILLQELLARGYWISAFLRHPGQLPHQEHKRLEIIQGEQVVYRELITALEGQHVVIICLQYAENNFAHKQNVLDAMKLNHVSILIIIQQAQGAEAINGNHEVDAPQKSNTANITVFQIGYSLCEPSMDQSFEARFPGLLAILENASFFWQPNPAPSSFTFVDDQQTYLIPTPIPDV